MSSAMNILHMIFVYIFLCEHNFAFLNIYISYSGLTRL